MGRDENSKTPKNNPELSNNLPKSLIMRSFGLFLLLLHLASADDNSDGRGLDSDRTVKHVEKNNDIVVSNNLETRSRLILLNGNMHFRAGIRRNITFDVGDDGGIFFHNLNILDIPSREDIAFLRSQIRSNGAESASSKVQKAVMERQFSVLKGMLVVTRAKQISLEEQFKKFNASRARGSNQRRIRQLMYTLNKQVDRLYKLMKTNECDDKPCQNGGTCLDLFAAFHCLCPPHMEGPHCEKRFDECAMIKGTHADCQNGGTCVNNEKGPGTTCKCPPNTYGSHCQEKSGECTATSTGLCGEHGHCVSITPSYAGAAPYKCVCDYGYRSNEDIMQPLCIDIDECAGEHTPCFKGYGNECLNLPGGFKCTGCPKGFYGDGITCEDINECYSDPCSQNPRVECINTKGSFSCAACPAGYEGDGFYCKKIEFCANNPCNDEATCIEEPNEGCLCPEDKPIGSGLKDTECHRTYYYGSGRCSVCENGATCQKINETHANCFCAPGFHGDKCEFEDKCYNEPDFCGEVGTCHRNENDAYCVCPNGFTTSCGIIPQKGVIIPPDTCGMEFIQDSGNYTMTLPFYNSEVCTLTMKSRDTRKILKVWVTNYTHSDLDPGFDNIHAVEVKLKDATNSWRYQLPTKTSPYYTKNSHLHVIFFVPTPNDTLQATVHWQAVEPICGGRLDVSNSPFSFKSSKAWEECQWFLDAPNDQLIEVTVEKMITATGAEVNCTVNSLRFYDSGLIDQNVQMGEICADVEQPYVKRFSTNHASLQFTYDSYMASEETLRDCKLSTSSTNNTDDAPRCGIYFMVSFKGVPKTTDCGGVINAQTNPVGFIQTPNFGHAYPPDLMCVWEFKLRKDPNETLSDTDLNMFTMDVVEFDVRGSNEPVPDGTVDDDIYCPGDFIEFDDITKHCNGNRLPVQLHFFDEFKLEFHSDSQYSGKGFKMLYKASCYHSYSNPTGIVRSPNLRVRHHEPFTCTYNIHAPSSAIVKLKFDYIGLPGFSVGCLQLQSSNDSSLAGYDDYIELSGGHTSDASLNRRYHCARYPFVAPSGELIVSGTSGVQITYSTSGSANNTGFLFSYTVEEKGCGGYYHGESGVIKSPNYPNKYPNHMYCIYTIKTKGRQAVRLTFDDFDVENVASRLDCGFDAVEIYDTYQNEKKHGKLLGRYCGVANPPPIVSASGTLVVVFTSDRSVNGIGFTAHYDVVNLHNFCDVTLTQQSGVLEFNRSNYGNIEECNFRIVLPAMARIHLNITDVYMPCEDGVVTLRNGGHSDSPKFPQLWPDSSFCDSKPVPELITQGNQAFISLLVKSTRNTTLRIEYKMIEQSCGGSIRGYTGEIATPQYPKADSHQLMCEWEITVAPGNRIRFQIDKMDDLASADHNGVCQPFARNYIDLAEGPRSDPTVLRKYCKREVAPEPLITSDNSLVVKYNQVGGSINGGLFGFLGRFVTVCNNIVLSKPFGSIQSPGYPYPTEEARVCSWTIRTAPGSRIKVIFHRFRLDGSMIIRSRGFTECMSNYLSVRTDQIEHVEGTEDGKATDKMKATKFCNGFAEPQRIFSKSNELQFNFTNTKQAKENHFWLSWSTEGCGDYVYSNATKLSVDVSDFVAANLSLRRECNWVMYAPIGYVIKVDVMEMHTVEQINTGVCPDKINELNGVMFFTGTNFTDYPQWSYCGRIIGQNKTYTSHTNRLAMRLGMDAKYKTSRNGTVFRAFVTYVKLDNDLTCTGKVKVLPGHNQTITSPGFPTKYPRAIECAWQFETVKGFSLAYNLSHFVTPGKRRPPQLGFPTNIRCSSALMYIEGGLAVYSGEYARNDRLYSSYRESKGAVSRICNDITEPVIFNVLTNESTVTFHGAPYDATVPSGDSGRKDKVGFVLEAFAVCGGTLEAGAERRTLSLREHMLHNNGGCAFKVTRENQTLLDQKIVVGFELLDLNAFDDDKEVFINVTCGISRKPNYASTKNRHINTVECTEDILVEVSEIPQNVTFMLHYDTVGYMCGDIGDAVKGIYEISGDIDCDYVLENSAGNKVVLHIDESTIPESEDCAQSYVEIREGKRKRLLSRLCGNISPRKYEAEKLYLRVLRKPFETAENEDDEDVPTTPAPTNWLKFRFEKSLGGVVKSNKIILPVGSPRIRPADETIVWSVRTNKSDEHIEVTFRTLIGVKVQINEEVIDSLADDEPTRIYTSNELEIKALAPRTDISHFELTWKPIRPAANGSEAVGKTVYVEEEFTCGGELEATFSPKNLTLPTSDVNKYANDLKCRWKIKRPLLHGISFKLKLLDVEEHANCAYDYLTVGTREFATLRELEDATFMHRICRKDQANYATLINYDDEAFIYFVSDRSKSFSGFTLEYKLDCRTFEYLNAEKNKFVYTLNSPLYPETGGHNFSCMWGIMLETNRDLIVKAISMDLAPPQEDNQCKGEYLLVNSVPHSNNAGNNVHYYCGNNLFNYTAKYGRVFITYENSGETQPAVRRQGFQLLIEEITHMCSETLYLDEIKKKGVIQSPGYPENSPNSLDCEWIIAAPPGHRIKFTVDTEQFMLENADPDECKDDYLEIYDGPSGSSPLIGKFCGDDPPSTLFSTDSHLFVRFVTDYYSPSEGWKATYELASCGGTVVLSPSVNTSITSPNFPEAYPAQEECEWIVKAPKGHFVEGHLKHLWLAISDNCKQEYVTVLDGLHPGVAPNTTENRTVLLPPSCSMRSVNDRHFHSHHGTALVKFMANTTYARGASRLFCLNRKCGFEIELSASKYECGGDVEDDEGQLVVPGYPDHVLPGVECVWNFKAGIGYRYKLDLEFVNEDGFYEHIPSINGGPEQPCFPDLEAWNGPVESRYSLYSLYQRFCVNRTSFVSNADIMTVVYEDRAKVYRSVMYTGIDSTRFHKPFRLRYTRVDEDFDEFACMWHVYDDQNITIHDMSIKRSYSDMMGLTNTGSKSFCHIRIENQKKESTVALYFTDFRAGRPNIRLCGQSSNQVHIVGQTLDEWPIKDVLCSGIVQHNVYNNSYNSRILDIFIMNNPFSLVPNIDQPVQFNLSIVYNQCGGDITEELYGNFGTIRAPGTQDGGNYSNNADCLWHLKAPEGLVIKLSVTKMDLEYDVYCNHDVLEVAEGLATSSQLHRYCNSELIPDTALEDRFKRLISRGRYLTLHFHSNNEINGKGFEIDWEFVTPDSNNSCGFHTHAMEGEIVSPGYPDVDYPNYASCLWEISVPPGFHVKLNFDRLDIAKSAGCLKDYLAVYQEHQSRGKDPMRNYLFYFDHDELVKRICGIDAIAPIETESRRVRLNFTTNNDITARGFRLTWEAKCGTVFQLNHGEVMSPFYPSYYPNEDMECIYQINPPTKYTQIVTIRIDDLELDDTLVDGKRKPCGSDYVQIIDVAANRVAFTACGRNNEEAGFSPISIKGPVAVRFVSNTTFFQDNKRKRMRGFHLTYALSDCGGEIVLDEETSHMTGTITSPSFPLPYHHKLNCVWNVTAPDGYVIAAKFRQMDIEGSEQCYFDYIELWDGVEATNTTTWGRICGQTPPFGTKMTKTNNMLIQFHTDETTSKGGFSLVLTATLGPEKGCGGEIRADTEWRTIQPPLSKGEEMDTYMNNLRCWWRISADKGSVIEFKLSDVDLEQRRVMGNGSCYDFLAIYDGPQGISPWLLRPSCLAKDFDQEHLHYYSSYKKADVYFETDSSDAFGGFTLQFRAIEPDCGGVYTAKAGEDQLLVYNSQRTLTRTHQRYKRCRFFIRGEENEPIELSMNSFSFPTKTAKCDEEFFEVSDVGTVAECQHPACATEQKDAQNIYRTCGSNVFWRFVSKTSLVQIVTSVVLQSQFTSSFNLTYTLLDSCNRTITVDDPYSRFASGRVHSPNFPYQYDANSTCITRIKVPDEYRILLVFKQFMIERGAYTLRRNPYWRRIQGEPGSRGIPRLYSKRQVGQFRGIGGQMTSFGGISKFFDDNCKFDALRVTYNMTGNLTKTLCGFATPPPVLSAQNQMVLNFTSDASSNHGGFDANYYLIKTYQQEYQKLYEYAPIYEKSGVVVNLGFPGYSVNTTYRAFVLPPRGMTCEMSITRYLNKDLVTCNNGDVLKVATVTDDGTHWTEIECASEMSVRKISAGLVQKEIQSFKIEFNTDSDAANDGRGFMATWDCSEAVTEVLVTDQWDTKIVE